MSQNESESNNFPEKQEAAKFYNEWMTKKHEGDSWDEMCLQWCKQQKKARENNSEPNCSMYCLKRPFEKQQTESWNPLNGYSVSVIKGTKECLEHTNDMKLTPTKEDSITNEESQPLPTKYEVDLGNMWSENEVKAKQFVNDKFIPYYNSSIEKAINWKNSPQATEIQEYVKTKANSLLGYVYPLSPLNLNNSQQQPVNDEKKP